MSCYCGEPYSLGTSGTNLEYKGERDAAKWYEPLPQVFICDEVKQPRSHPLIETADTRIDAVLSKIDKSFRNHSLRHLFT